MLESVPRIASPERGIALMLAAMFIFTILDAAQKTLILNYEAAQLILAQFCAMIPIGFVAARIRGQRLRLHRPGLLLARGALLVISSILFVSSLRFLPLANAHSLAFTAPLFAAALAVPLLGERIGLARAGAIAAGMAGMLIILRPGSGLFQLAALLPVGAAFFYALYQIVTRKLAPTVDPATILFYSGLIAGAMVLAAAPWYWRTPTSTDLWLMLAVGCLGGFANLLLILAIEAVPVGLLQPYHYSQLVWSVAFSTVLFGEFPDRWTLIGAGVIVTAGLYVLHRERQAAAKIRGSA
jgi:drug/metabolite transporter (DMT)-like permease